MRIDDIELSITIHEVSRVDSSYLLPGAVPKESLLRVTDLETMIVPRGRCDLLVPMASLSSLGFSSFITIASASLVSLLDASVRNLAKPFSTTLDDFMKTLLLTRAYYLCSDTLSVKDPANF
jgi:hypothetical protein